LLPNQSAFGGKLQPIRISVVIPVYNGAAFIQRALDSVFTQTYPATEIIVIDDGSTDGTAEILVYNQPAVQVITQPNSGRSVARNAGMLAAKGDYVAFLDADDQFLPNHLEHLATESDLLNNEIVYDVIGPPFFIPGERLPEKPYGDRSYQHLACCRIWTVNAMVRREWILAQNVKFDEGLSISEDAVFFWKMILLGARVGYIRKIGTMIGIHEANTTSDPVKTMQASSAAYDAIEQFIVERGILLNDNIRRHISMGRRHKQIMAELLYLHGVDQATKYKHIGVVLRMALAPTPTRLIERCRCVLVLMGIVFPGLIASSRVQRAVFGFSVSRSRPFTALAVEGPV
jgi:glycosyltransferase involved in cell wall biosynthesis